MTEEAGRWKIVEPVDLMMLTELDPVVKRGLVTGVSLVPRRYEDHDSNSRENLSRGVGKLLQLSTIIPKPPRKRIFGKRAAEGCNPP